MNPPVVLIVDDDDLLRWSLRERLAQAGYTTLEAATGSDALRQFRDLTRALRNGGVDPTEDCPERMMILLGRKLPDGDGLALVGQFKSFCPRCEVVLIVAGDAPETVHRAETSGVYRVVDKPFNLDAMVDLVSEICAA